MHYCPHRLTAYDAHPGRDRITTRLDVSLSGVRTTRLLRPRTALPVTCGLACARPQGREDRCSSAVSSAAREGSQKICPADHTSAPTLPRPPPPGPHVVTIAIRPWSQGRVAQHIRYFRISVNRNLELPLLLRGGERMRPGGVDPPGRMSMAPAPKASRDRSGPKARRPEARETRHAVERDETGGPDRDLVRGEGGTIDLPDSPGDLSKDD